MKVNALELTRKVLARAEQLRLKGTARTPDEGKEYMILRELIIDSAYVGQ